MSGILSLDFVTVMKEDECIYFTIEQVVKYMMLLLTSAEYGGTVVPPPASPLQRFLVFFQLLWTNNVYRK